MCVCVCLLACVSVCVYVCECVLVSRCVCGSCYRTSAIKFCHKPSCKFSLDFFFLGFCFFLKVLSSVFFWSCFKVGLSCVAAVYLAYIYTHSRTLIELPNYAPMMMMMMTTAATIKRNFFDYFMHSGSCATSAFSLRQPQCNCGSASLACWEEQLKKCDEKMISSFEAQWKYSCWKAREEN